jgi:formate--tetrahydrofolate ligase
VREKIAKICSQAYGGEDVVYAKRALLDLRRIARLGLEGLPICMAKTAASLSDDGKRLGRPEGFTITVREIQVAAGAGFLVPITGDIMRMPGLPKVPGAEGMRINADGEIEGLS